MNGIDILTRDIAAMKNGARFASWGYDRHGTEWPVSGDMLAKMRNARRVDAILAGGVYVDRRGSRWERTDQGEYTQWWSEDEWPCIEHADMLAKIRADALPDE